MTTENPKTEDQEVMPSFFPHINQSESHQLADWLFLREYITHDPALKRATELYRQRLTVGKKFADEMKPTFPAITTSALMDGYGRKLENFWKPTFKIALDFDHVKKQDLERYLQLVRQDPHTLAEYITVSGKGFRVICSYKAHPDLETTILELFDLMVHKAMDYYTHLLGISPDKQCTDITRCTGLCYDPDAFFRWEGVPFEVGVPEMKMLFAQRTVEAKQAKRNAKRKQKMAKINAPSMSSQGAPTIEEAIPHIQQLLSQWGHVFESGRHNDYVCHFADICLRYGIDLNEVLKYADAEYGKDYAPTASVIKNVYKHIGRMGTWHFYRPDEGYSRKPTVKAVKQWLTTRYEFRRNVITGFYEIKSRMVYTGKYPRWTQIDDTIENSLWTEMDEDSLRITDKMLHSIINSDFSEPFDPLDDYLRTLKPWNAETDPDYIAELTDRIEIQERPDAQHTQELFRYFFKKWLVAMVVAWVTLSVVNQMILIFVGKGGIMKTTFFAWLLPPALRQYFLNDSTGAYTDKDFMEGFSSKALLCLDEFESIFGKNLSAFKSNITKLTFSIRRPYDKYRSELPHRGSLCGTTNSQQFITDEENRRYCPWIVKSIKSPIDHPIDYDHVFSQAVALGKLVTEHPKGAPIEWTYWLTRDDIELLRQHNRIFMVANYAEEQILRYYRVPDSSTNPEYIKFRYSAEILEKIGVNPALRQNLNSQNIGSVMARLGFQKIHKKGGNGWAVIEKEGMEIATDSTLGGDEIKQLSSGE